MNIYDYKRRWKWFLLGAAMVIVVCSLWYTNILVRQIASDERKKVEIWAAAIQKKASLVKYTEEFFEKLKIEERKRVKLWAEATSKLINAGNNEDLTFYLDIISSNTNIPVILTDEKFNITSALNVEFNTDSVKVLSGALKKEFSEYDPIEQTYGTGKNILFYKDSRLFSELRNVLDDIIKSFIAEVVINSASAPVIITDSTKSKIIAYGNIDTTKIHQSEFIRSTITSMQSQNKPIELKFVNYGKSYIYYRDSYLLTQLRYYPYVQFVIIGLFLIVAYFLFSSTRKAEQNQVWLGMAKETAHQLGTPLSSLIAWMEFLKTKGVDDRTVNDIRKDVKRLENITDRFSKIGSPPKLQKENIIKVIYNSIEYLKSRTSKSIAYSINLPETEEVLVPLNAQLFEWVIENLCKNSIDAMSGNGTIDIHISDEITMVYIDISDTGKGIPKSKYKTIFNPGYTSKQRGWGLGLTLAERIIENYHSGHLFVKQSVLNKGTTFRIVLKK